MKLELENRGNISSFEFEFEVAKLASSSYSSLAPLIDSLRLSLLITN